MYVGHLLVVKLWFEFFFVIHMLYYKFLNDKKGELSQLWIASQSPNKVSKRVILDISISVLLSIAYFFNV